jgi:peptidylprolyl isomerase
MQAKNGDVVSVHYTGKHTDGAVFDSSIGDEPLQFKLGESNMIVGFQEAVMGMLVGEKKTVSVACDKAYGLADPELVYQVPRGEIPADIPIEVGMILTVRSGEEENLVQVVEVTREYVALDQNHPLAGFDLIFEMELVAIA